MVNLSHLIVTPPLLSQLAPNFKQRFVIKLFVARELFPKLKFLLCVELDMAQFFFFGSFDLNINFIFGLSDKSIVVFKVDVDLLLKPVS